MRSQQTDAWVQQVFGVSSAAFATTAPGASPSSPSGQSNFVAQPAAATRAQAAPPASHGQANTAAKGNVVAPAKPGQPKGTAGISREDLENKIATAEDRADKALQTYHTAKVGAAYANKIEDPGSNLEKIVAVVHKGAATATAAIKAADLGKANKFADTIDGLATQANQLATKYAVDMDTAVSSLKLTSMNTPWGEIQWVEETGNVNSLVLRVSQTFEFDKPYVAKFKATMKALQDAVKPVADFAASPEKAEQEIAKFASPDSVKWASDAHIEQLLQKLKNVLAKGLQTSLATANSAWESASLELQASAQQEEARKLLARVAEEKENVEFALELFKAGVETIASEGEAAPEAAAEIVGAIIKRFHGHRAKERADELEKSAHIFHEDSVRKSLEGAKKATEELEEALDELSPITEEAREDIKLNMGRATHRFEKDCRGNCKFKFSDVESALKKALPLYEEAEEAADERLNQVWQSADALLKLLVDRLGKGSWDYVYQGMKLHKADGQVTGVVERNAGVISAIRKDITKYSEECRQQRQQPWEPVKKLYALHGRAFKALAKARPEG